ncbi:MAG: hypothetical protein AB8H12_02280 [Lewinella sp.]
MFPLPSFNILRSTQSRNDYAELYEQSSGLPIPQDYLHDPANRVFGIVRDRVLVGGFILGEGEALRTVKVFASPADQVNIDGMAGDVGERTEITCFWISAAVRREVTLNRFIWISMIYALTRYSKRTIVFGTCSKGLARLYATSQRAELVSRDRIDRKSTFIFRAEKRDAIAGFCNILAFKSTWKWNPLRWIMKSKNGGLATLSPRYRRSAAKAA